MSLSAIELIGLVPGGTAAGTMLILTGMNLLASMERRLQAETAPVAIRTDEPAPAAVTDSQPAPLELRTDAVAEAAHPDRKASRPLAPLGAHPLRPGRRLAQGRAYIGIRLHCRTPLSGPEAPS